MINIYLFILLAKTNRKLIVQFLFDRLRKEVQTHGETRIVYRGFKGVSRGFT